MSTGLECAFVEVDPGRWYYALENGFGDRNSSWLDSADAYGPFATFDEAHAHLTDNHSNPGGFSMAEYDGSSLSRRWQRLIDAAPESMAALGPSYGRW